MSKIAECWKHPVHVIDDRSYEYPNMDVVYAANVHNQEMIEAANLRAKEQLEHIARKQHLLGVDITTHLKSGQAGAQIIEAAEEFGDNLIVIATHGRTGLDRWVFGSTCEKVVRTSPIPVLTVKHPEHEFVSDTGDEVALNQILCPIDFSDLSRFALRHAEEICKDFGATMTLCHVVDPRNDYPEISAQAKYNNTPHLMKMSQEYLDSIAAEIKGINVEVIVCKGTPAEVLANKTKELNVDLVVMSTHGRGGLAHMILGSVAERMIRMANCPVLTVRPSI